MAQGLRQLASTGVTTGRQHHAPGDQSTFQAPPLNHESSIGPAQHPLHHHPGFQLHTGGLGSILQTANHSLRTILLRKHSAVGLLHQGEPAIIKPGDGVATGKATEWAP